MYKKLSISFSMAILLLALTSCGIPPSESASQALDPAIVQEKGDMIVAKATNSYSGNKVSYYINGKEIASGVIHKFNTSITIHGEFKGHEFLAVETWRTNGFGKVWNVSQIYIDGHKVEPDLRF